MIHTTPAQPRAPIFLAMTQWRRAPRTVAIGVGTGTAMDLANGSDRTIYARQPQRTNGFEIRS